MAARINVAKRKRVLRERGFPISKNPVKPTKAEQRAHVMHTVRRWAAVDRQSRAFNQGWDKGYDGALAVRGEARKEALVLVGSTAVGIAAAPRLNAVVTARPLGRHVPPSVGAAIASGIAGALARRAGMRRTAVAATGFAIGLGIGTALSAKRPGGLLDSSAGGGA